MSTRMRPFTRIVPLDEALARLREASRPIGRTEHLPLDEAHARVLAAPVVSADDVPPFDRAMMDGYAVRAGETSGASRDAPVTLRRLGILYAGEVFPGSVAPGTCVEIATGAPIPDGADAVVMVEETANGPGDQVLVLAPVRPGQNVSPRGHDIAAGDVVVEAGEQLSAGRLGALAAVGAVRVTVYARPRVAILSTGNELVDPNVQPRPGQIRDINRHTLAAVIRSHGGDPRPLGIVADTLPALREALETARRDADLLVFSGGSSVGERDLLLDVLRDEGEMLFHGVAVRPGKPTALARLGALPVLGMPGNPTSCLSNAYVFLVPLLRAVARLPAWEPRRVTVPLARDVRNAGGRHTFLPVRLTGGRAEPVFRGSGDITSLSRADGYIEVPADVTSLAAGTQVTVTVY